MNCDNCGEAEATIHQIHVTNNEIEHLQLCETCAREQSDGDQPAEAGVAEAFEGIDTEERESDTCPSCGTTLIEVRKRNKVGCAECYGTFREQFASLVHRIHGAEQHIGDTGAGESDDTKAGLGKIPDSKKVKMLEKRLQKSVEEEDYERAAELRDKIENLQEESDNEPAR